MKRRRRRPFVLSSPKGQNGTVAAAAMLLASAFASPGQGLVFLDIIGPNARLPY
jgi:hypothetical protein